MKNANLFVHYFVVVTVLVLVSVTLVCVGQWRYMHCDGFADRTYISTLHTSSRSPPLTVCVAQQYLPCDTMVHALRQMRTPLTPCIQTSMCSSRREVECSDLVTQWVKKLDKINTRTILTCCPKTELILTVIACLPSAFESMTLYEAQQANLRIFCTNRTESRLMIDLCNSIVVPFEVEPTIASFDKVDQGIFVLLRSPNHEDVRRLMARKDAVMVVLPQLDPHVFAMHQPLAKLTGNGGGGGVRVSSSCVLTVDQDMNGDPRAVAIARQLISLDAMWSLGEINMASRFLSVLPSTLVQLEGLNKAARKRESLGSHQLTVERQTSSLLQVDGFVQLQPTTLLSTEPIEGYITSQTREGRAKVFETRSTFIGAVRMQLGDRVSLRDQPNSLHDGDYIVERLPINDRGTVLVTWFEANYDAMTFHDIHADIEKDATVSMHVTLDSLMDHSRGRLWPAHVAVQPKDMLLLRNLGDGEGVWTEVVLVQRGIVHIQTVSQVVNDASKGSCVTSPTTSIQSVCLIEGGVWDAPCEHDDQCPFFQKNKRYPNYRGGCASSGRCEMPLGVKQESYRTYSGTPICHSHSEHSQGTGVCNSSNPDLAFALDEFDRSTFVHTTYVST